MPKPRRQSSKADTMDAEIRATCAILESVAKGYPQRSAEREAVQEAAHSFIYLRLHEGLRASYEAYRRSLTKPLTKAQTRVLERMGIST